MGAWPRKQNPSLCSPNYQAAWFKNTWHINAARFRNSVQHLRKYLRHQFLNFMSLMDFLIQFRYVPFSPKKKQDSILYCQCSGLKSWIQIVFPAAFTLSPSLRSHKHKGLWVCSYKKLQQNSFGKPSQAHTWTLEGLRLKTIRRDTNGQI